MPIIINPKNDSVIDFSETDELISSIGESIGEFDNILSDPYYRYWSVSNTLTGCSSSNANNSVVDGGSYSATITADEGYTLTGASVSVSMGGTDITNSAYNELTGKISIPAVNGNVVITITAVASGR